MDLLQGAWRPRQRVALVIERDQAVQLVLDLGVLDPGENQYRGQTHEGGRNAGRSGDLGEVALVACSQSSMSLMSAPGRCGR